MGLGDIIKGIWDDPEWELPDENELTREIERLEKEIKMMPKKSLTQ